MADWKAQLSYNYNQSYHYTCGLVYSAGSEQGHPSLAVPHWAEHGGSDLSGYGPGGAGGQAAYYPAAPRPRDEESPPRSPEHIDGHGQYQGSGAIYLRDAQADRLFLADHPHPSASYEAPENDGDRTRSDTPTSYSEAHTSPDSWSSGSSREGSLPQADPVAWAKKDQDETDSVCAGEEALCAREEPPAFVASAADVAATTAAAAPAPLSAPKKASAVVNRGKVRTAYTEGQKNTLVQRFSLQMYLTPAEMKNLSGHTGLSYTQVKTWFQNRRMKLRKNQKDKSWVSEHYNAKKESPGPNAALLNTLPQHVQPYPGEGRAGLHEQYSHQMRDAAFFNKTPPQNLLYYLAARPPGYQAWSPNGPQTLAATARSQAASWPVAPAGGHYDYNPAAFGAASTSAADAGVNDTGGDEDFGNPLHLGTVHSAGQ